MKLNFARLLLASLAALLLGACTSEVNKLIKANDKEGMYKKSLEFFAQKKYSKTISLLEECGHFFSGTEREDSVAYYLSTSYYKTGDFEVSSELFNEFRRRYGRSPFLEDVEYMYSMSYYYSSMPANRDQTMTMRAIAALSEYLGRYPNSVKKENMQGYIKELTQRLHDKVYLNARVYFDIGQYKSAVMALQNALDKYPQSSHREELMFLILKSNYLYAKNSFEQFQRDRYVVMMDAYYNFTAEFPDSKQRREADKMQSEAKQVLAKYNIDKEDGSKEE